MNHQPFQVSSIEYLSSLLPQYEIQRFIAQSGKGAIYKARQISLDRDVAIKILPQELGEDAKFRESFESEAKAMARLNHPNLLDVFEFGNAGGMPYIVMEYVHGKSLHELAWNNAVVPTKAVAIVKGICDGLAHAHGNGIVHCDIKPSNIIITQQVVPKICDFGLAHVADSDKLSLVMGTPGYTAPEVFLEPNLAGPLADIYSVGVVLHQLLTGVDPAGCMEPPAQVTDNPRLDEIWRKATHIDPARRYQSVAAFGAELDNHFTSKSAIVDNVALHPKCVPSVPRGRPFQVKIVGNPPAKLVLICILAMAAIFTFHITRRDQNREIPVGVEVANGTKATEPFKAALERTPSDSISHNPAPNPKPVEVTNHEDPAAALVVESKPEAKAFLLETTKRTNASVVESNPEVKPVVELPPGDPGLQARAIDLIADSRKKRDKALAENVRLLRSDLAARVRSAKADEVSLIERFQKEIADNRIPAIDGVQAFGDRLASFLNQVCAKQESIEASHRLDLIRIRDSYVTRLEGATAAAPDDNLKRRLLAQAGRAGDLDSWIRMLSPEPERVPKKFSAVGIVGKWTTGDDAPKNHWIAYPDGRVEVVGRDWKAHWVILEDGSLEIMFAGKKGPNKYTRNGAGWTGKTAFGLKATLTPGNW